ncbi:LAETG motif-containing sortase-dependent surface protein [Kitasatospora sp. NPDC001660]
MRTSVITRFAKNTRSLSTRRRIAVLAATTVLAGGVQVIAASDSAWACSGPYESVAPTTAPTAPTTTHHGDVTPGFHQTRDGQTITAGGPKVEVGVGITNFTGAPYDNVVATLSLYNPDHGTNLRPEDFTVEANADGTWQPLALRHGCDPTLFTNSAPATTIQHLEDGRAAHLTFRIGLSAKAPKDLTRIQIGILGQAPDSPSEVGKSFLTFPVARSAAPTTAKPTATAEPKPAPAEPAADRTPTAPASAAAEAPKSPKSPAPQVTSSTPATTAPVGTPELAQTGSSETNGFLAASAAALLALGAGVLIAVRRLRHQR